MPSYRIIDARGTQEGGDAFVHRLFPVPAAQRHHDPFVLWDHFTLQGGSGFPPHPHRGFEGITYVLDGSMQHEDSLGNHSTVKAGGIQRFTAGKGIVHSEVPAAQGETNGIQLWVNLAVKDKQLIPSYQAVDASVVSVSAGDGWRARHILGRNSSVQLHSNADMLDLSIDADTTYLHSVPKQHQGLVYLLRGHIRIAEQDLHPQQALLFSDATELYLNASSDAQLIIASGRPHAEPIRQNGPFVD